MNSSGVGQRSTCASTDLDDGGVEGVEVQKEDETVIKTLLGLQDQPPRVGRLPPAPPTS